MENSTYSFIRNLNSSLNQLLFVLFIIISLMLVISIIFTCLKIGDTLSKIKKGIRKYINNN